MRSFATREWRTRRRQTFDPALFDGDENAIVDFKYSSDPRLTWWFDHHQSAFLTPKTPSTSAAIPAAASSTTRATNPAPRSSAAVAGERFGFRAPDLDDLVHWSLIIDGAQYPDARTAVELGAPAMKLTLVIEAAKGSDIVQKIIGWMQRRQLAEIIAEPEIQALYEPLYQRHLESIDIIREPGARRKTAWCFSTWRATTMEGYNKFIPYYLFPDSMYTVSVSPSSFRTKISVGSNPWAAGGAEAQPGQHLRALRRRRPRAGGRHQPGARRTGAGPRIGGGDCGGVEVLNRPAS